MIVLLLAALAVIAAARPALAVIRFIRMGPAARRNYPAALWAKIRWRWLVPVSAWPTSTSTAAAACAFPARRRSRSLRLAGTGCVTRTPGSALTPTASRDVKTVPKVGRKQLEDNAEHIANSWCAVRCQVHQLRPGRVVLRGCALIR